MGELRGKVQAMVDSFLNIMFGKCDSSTYLVISIDDLDMNLENSFDIVDDIRKFLTIKHVVVLTSVDIEQLKELVCLHFNKPFGNKAGSTGEVMGQKYIEKIFPITRQMEMSRLSTEELSKRYIGNLLGDGEDTTRENIGLLTAYGDMTYDPYITITHGILHLIYRKTMLLLVPEDNERHWLIPHNLRELCNFIYLLQKMDDVAFNEVDDNGNKKYVLVNDKQLKENKLDIMEDNLRKLMQYIVSDLLDYSTVHMDDETKKMAEVLTKLIRDLPEWTLVTMNKKIVQDILMQVEKSELYQKFYNEQQRKSLLNATYQVHLISMGDVQHVLGALSLRTNDLTIKRLVEYIRVIWSIRMTIEFYCVGLRYNDNEKMKELYENPDENETFCNNGYITKRFREAVGGLIVNPESATLLKLKPKFREAHSHKNNEELMVKGDWIRIHIENENDMKTKGIGGIAVLSCSSINSYTINDEKGGTVVVDTVIDGDCNWRALTSKPYYRNNKAICDGYYVYTNYMALFTNLLAIEDIWGDEEFKNICKTWQHDNVIVFPFYSMNWMNRFYKELKNQYENDPESNTIKEAIEDLCNRIKGDSATENGDPLKIKGVVKKMEEITGQYIYIPEHSEDRSIGEEGYCLTGNNYTVRLKKRPPKILCKLLNKYFQSAKTARESRN